MKIKRCPVIFNNVLSVTTKCKSNEWYFAARDLRNEVIKSGLYGTGPIIYQVLSFDESKDEAEYKFYLPVNAPLELNKSEQFEFYSCLKFDDGIVIRQVDIDENNEEYNTSLREYAKKNKLVLQVPFYNIYLDVYGGGLIDIYAPIVKED